MSTNNVSGQLYAQVRENPFGEVPTPVQSPQEPKRENPFGGSSDQVQVSPSPSPEIPRNNPFGASPSPSPEPITSPQVKALTNGETITFPGGIADGDEITVDEDNKLILLRSSSGEIRSLPFERDGRNNILLNIGNLTFMLGSPSDHSLKWDILTEDLVRIDRILSLGLNEKGELLINGYTSGEIFQESSNQPTPQANSTLERLDQDQLLTSAGNTLLKLGTSFGFTTLGGLGVGALLGLLGLTSLPILATAGLVALGMGGGAVLANLIGQTIIDGRNLSEVNFWEAGVDGAIATFTGGLGKYFTLASKLGRAVPNLVRAFAGEGSWLSRIFVNSTFDVTAGGVIRATDGDNQTRALDWNAIAFDAASSVVLGETANLVSRISGPRVDAPSEPTPTIREEASRSPQNPPEVAPVPPPPVRLETSNISQENNF
jgi:hypothetical protein